MCKYILLCVFLRDFIFMYNMGRWKEINRKNFLSRNKKKSFKSIVDYVIFR